MIKQSFIISAMARGVSSINTSIGQRAISFAHKLASLQVSKITVLGVEDYIERFMAYQGKRILIDFRMGDILRRRNEIGSQVDSALMLYHEHDANFFKKEDYATLNDFFARRGTKVATVSSHGKEIFLGKGVNINSGVIRIPLKKFSEDISSRSCIKLLESKDKPQVLLWLTPAVRKNSYFAMLSILEAISIYSRPVKLVIVSRYYEPYTKDISNLFSFTGLEVEEYLDPSDSQLDRITSSSTLVYLPSFDEGLHLPIYEAGRLGTDVITTGIPIHLEASRMYKSIKLIPLHDNYTVVGNKMDEISTACSMKFPIYSEAIEMILYSLKNWSASVDRMKKVFIRNSHRIQPWRVNINALSAFTGISQRRTPGKGIIEII